MTATPVARITIERVTEQGGLQYVSGRTMAGERVEDVLRIEPHGMASNPPLGSVAVVQFLGADRARGYVVGGETPDKRPAGLKTGNASFYDAGGNRLDLNSAAGVVLDAKGRPVRLKGAQLTLEQGAGAGPARIVVAGDCNIEVTGSAAIAAPSVRLGPAGSGQSPVMTTAGPSPNVTASS